MIPGQGRWAGGRLEIGGQPLAVTVVTIRTRDGQETLAIPTIDLPLVHAALELANAENPLNAGPDPKVSTNQE
jgi:hypothetical protein